MTMIRSDIAKITEEANAIALLKREQCSYHERSLKNVRLLVDMAKNFSMDNTSINVTTPSPDGKDIIDIVKSDLEKLKDEMNDIAMLKSELWSYQINISQKINSLQKPA